MGKVNGVEDKYSQVVASLIIIIKKSSSHDYSDYLYSLEDGPFGVKHSCTAWSFLHHWALNSANIYIFRHVGAWSSYYSNLELYLCKRCHIKSTWCPLYWKPFYFYLRCIKRWHNVLALFFSLSLPPPHFSSAFLASGLQCNFSPCEWFWVRMATATLYTAQQRKKFQIIINAYSYALLFFILVTSPFKSPKGENTTLLLLHC